MASILAKGGTGHVVAFSVADPRRRPFDLDAFVREHQARLHLPSDRISTKTVEARHVTQAILQEAQEYDLLVLGRTEDPFVVRAARSSVPETVARECGRPVVMVKAAGGLRSWIKRWI